MKQIGQWRKLKIKNLSKRWFIEAFTGMAQGLFVTLIAGTIVKKIGEIIGVENAFGLLLINLGKIASMLMGAGIGAGIAYHLKASRLAVFSAMVAGMIGAWAPQITGLIAFTGDASTAIATFGAPGNPIGAYLCALSATEISKYVAGKTKLDILLVPLTMIATATVFAYAALPLIWVVNKIGTFINWATTIQPFAMGVLVSVTVGILLTMPTSSAAICIALSINGLAGGAAVVGCTAQMIGFAVLSYRENGFSGFVAQGLGTSMLQIPNIFKNPRIFIPPIIASAVVGPLATCVFKLECSPQGAGMGTSGLVGIFETVTTSISGGITTNSIVLGILLLFFVIPMVICIITGILFRKLNWIKEDDLKL